MLGPCQWDRRGGARIHQPATWTPPVALLYAFPCFQPTLATGRRDHKSLEEATGGYAISDGASTVRGFGDRAERTASVRDHEPKFRIELKARPNSPRRRRGAGIWHRRKRDARHPSGCCRNQRDRAVPGRGLRQGTVTCSRRRCRGADHQAVPKEVRHAAAERILKLQASAPLWSKLHKLPS